MNKISRHVNKLRWMSLSIIFLGLILLPLLSVYQNYVAAHAYDLLLPSEKNLYDAMAFITTPILSDPAEQLSLVKGTTWAGSFFGYKISDPLAVLSQMFSGLELYWPFVLTGLIPLVLTVLLGRFYCGWICPAAFLYELNTNFGLWLSKFGFITGRRVFDKRLKYGVLAACLLLGTATGTVIVSAIYPLAVIGRELYYVLALEGFSVGALFFALTMLFDLLVARRGFCRYLCPGGALYSLLGRYRLLRIQRKVQVCIDCTKCNASCEFDLAPMGDSFGQECNNCGGCIAACPNGALSYVVKIRDAPYQGVGHLGSTYKREQQSDRNNSDLSYEIVRGKYE